MQQQLHQADKRIVSYGKVMGTRQKADDATLIHLRSAIQSRQSAIKKHTLPESDLSSEYKKVVEDIVRLYKDGHDVACYQKWIALVQSFFLLHPEDFHFAITAIKQLRKKFLDQIRNNHDRWENLNKVGLKLVMRAIDKRNFRLDKRLYAVFRAFDFQPKRTLNREEARAQMLARQFVSSRYSGVVSSAKRAGVAGGRLLRKHSRKVSKEKDVKSMRKVDKDMKHVEKWRTFYDQLARFAENRKRHMQVLAALQQAMKEKMKASTQKHAQILRKKSDLEKLRDQLGTLHSHIRQGKTTRQQLLQKQQNIRALQAQIKQETDAYKNIIKTDKQQFEERKKSAKRKTIPVMHLVRHAMFH